MAFHMCEPARMDLRRSVILFLITGLFMSNEERAVDRWQNEGGKIKST